MGRERAGRDRVDLERRVSSTAEARSLDLLRAGADLCCAEEREEVLLDVLGVAALPLECFCFCLAEERMMERMF
jgi:hypothetical protein